MTRRDALLVPSGDDVIGVEVCGDGPAVVLLHGSGGNRATWFGQVVDLATSYTVVVVEARGSGRSTDLSDTAGPIAWAADLEVVREHLSLDAWHVLGHSSAGWTALRYARQWPLRCLSVVALSSLAGVFPPAAAAFWEEFTAGLAAQGWGAAELARPPSLTTEFCADRPDLAYLYQCVGALNPPVSMTSPALRIREVDLALEPFDVPVTFVTGSRDAIAPAAVVQACAEAVGADVRVVEGAGHLPFWEDAATFNALLRDLLAPLSC